MEPGNEISVELSALSAVVSGISRQTPYGVPVGYFGQFPTVLMSRISSRSSTFQVPEGYFDGLAAQVLSRIKAGKVAEDELPSIFRQISRITPYQIPEGYFDELSPVLTVAQDRSAYRAPEGYFAELPARILDKVVPNVVHNVIGPVTAAKVIPMERAATGGKVLKGHWWKYSSVAAIAACFLLIFSWPQVDNKVMEGARTPDITRALQNVSDKEMQAYLDDQHAILAEPVTNSTATLNMNEGEVKSLLGDVSDNDLQQYLEEHGKADELATN
jgi:hypothetical protein